MALPLVMATARKTIHARPRHLGKIHNRPRFDGVFDAVTITVYYEKKYQAYLVLIYDKIIRNLKFHANLHDFVHIVFYDLSIPFLYLSYYF